MSSMCAGTNSGGRGVVGGIIGVPRMSRPPSGGVKRPGETLATSSIIVLISSVNGPEPRSALMGVFKSVDKTDVGRPTSCSPPVMKEGRKLPPACPGSRRADRNQGDMGPLGDPCPVLAPLPDGPLGVALQNTGIAVLVDVASSAALVGVAVVTSVVDDSVVVVVVDDVSEVDVVTSAESNEVIVVESVLVGLSSVEEETAGVVVVVVVRATPSTCIILLGRRVVVVDGIKPICTPSPSRGGTEVVQSVGPHPITISVVGSIEKVEISVTASVVT